jgi:hypothetical protein
MTPSYNQARQLAQVMLKVEPEPTLEKIRATVDLVLKTLVAAGTGDGVDPEALAKDLETRFNVWVGSATTLDDPKGHEPWLANRRSQIKWRFWERYVDYLEQEKGWPPETINSLEVLTDLIVEKLEDPSRPGAWDRRGVVVGHVQSGKTSNYIGLISKAIDAGYKLVIVLAGMHKNLRSQTQLRIDEGLLGFDTRVWRAFNQTNLRIGAGAVPGAEFLIIHSLTSSEDGGDFKKTVASQIGVIPGGDPVVLVVKKHKSVLANLVNWALAVRGVKDSSTGKRIVRDVPLLMIDDEADNASINTNPKPRDEDGNILPDEDVTAINGQIRAILSGFGQSAYVGYTATPFANIFIHPEGESDKVGEDLFPRSFIVNLPVPSNYVGPVKVFGLSNDPESPDTGLPIVRVVDDFESLIPTGHKKHLVVDHLPASLGTALRAFVLSGAARLCRSHGEQHHSMLVHVTRFNAVQERVRQLVEEELTYLRQMLEHRDSAPARDLVEQFRKLWQEDFLVTTHAVAERLEDPAITPVPWSCVSERLFDAAARIQVKTINGSAADALDYGDSKSGLWAVAIGGDKLSRGLTLEGLTVSYFLRSSRMYDTLMQMGRWFGFRPGYADLCRLYTSDDLVTWYRHITAASEELREEFDHMAAIGGTPTQYGLRVRQHPSGLLITAVNKMRSGTPMKLSYANSISETIVFNTSRTVIDQNFLAFEDLLRELGEPGRKRNNYVWPNVAGTQIVDLLSRITTHADSLRASAGLLKKYVQAQLAHGELNSWTIALVSNANADAREIKIDRYLVRLTTRSPLSPTDGRHSIRRLVNPSDENIDLDAQQYDNALQRTQAHFHANPGSYKRKTPPDIPAGPYIREERKSSHGLLLVYPLESDLPTAPESVLMGFAFSFPASEKALPVEYLVNNVYWEQEFGGQ